MAALIPSTLSRSRLTLFITSIILASCAFSSSSPPILDGAGGSNIYLTLCEALISDGGINGRHSLSHARQIQNILKTFLLTTVTTGDIKLVDLARVGDGRDPNFSKTLSVSRVSFFVLMSDELFKLPSELKSIALFCKVPMERLNILQLRICVSTL